MYIKILMIITNHPSIHFPPLTILRVTRTARANTSITWKRHGTSWKRHQFIAGLSYSGYSNKQPSTLTFTSTGNFVQLISLIPCLHVLDCRRKPEYLVTTHADRSRTTHFHPSNWRFQFNNLKSQQSLFNIYIYIYYWI